MDFLSKGRSSTRGRPFFVGIRATAPTLPLGPINLTMVSWVAGRAPFSAVTLHAEMDRSAAMRGLLLHYAPAFHAQVTLTAACVAPHQH